jgi:hypothetical protein
MAILALKARRLAWLCNSQRNHSKPAVSVRLKIDRLYIDGSNCNARCDSEFKMCNGHLRCETREQLCMRAEAVNN